MCASMIDLNKAMTRITGLEEELKSTRDGYEEEIITLQNFLIWFLLNSLFDLKEVI